MNKVIASAGLLALGALGAQTAHAQLVAGAEKPWSISGTLRGFYDDNYNTEPNGPLKQYSWGYELRPSAQINWSAGPTTVNLSYIYSYKYYEARPDSKADQTHDVEFFLNHNFNERYSVDFTDSFVVAQEPEIIDPSFSGVTRANGNNLRNTAAINFHAELTHLWGLVLGYSCTYYDYDENAGNVGTANNLENFPTQSALLNRLEQYVHLDVRYQFNDTTTGILGYQFGVVTYNSDESIANNVQLFPGVYAPGYPYNNSPFAALNYVNPDTRNNYTHAIYVGVDKSFRSNLSLSSRIGVQIVDYNNAPSGSVSSDVGPYGDSSLNWTYMDGGTLTLGIRSAFQQTDLGANGVGSAAVIGPNGSVNVTESSQSTSVYLNDTQVLRPISPNLTANLSFQYLHNTFNGGTFDNETDNDYLLGLNLTYQITHYISAEVGYNYDLITSDVFGRGYDRNRVYIGLTATY